MRTTPSRDAVPQDDEWNIQVCSGVRELLANALRWLRANQMLDISALNCLPIDRSKFEGGMFAPLFDQVKATLAAEPLLPSHVGGSLSAKQAFLARGQDLRDLLDVGQIGELFAEGGECGWLTGEITEGPRPGVAILPDARARYFGGNAGRSPGQAESRFSRAATKMLGSSALRIPGWPAQPQGARGAAAAGAPHRRLACSCPRTGGAAGISSWNLSKAAFRRCGQRFAASQRLGRS